MGVSRTDYLMFGARVDPGIVSYDDFEAEMYQEEGARFDMVYDGMSGEYAVAGKILAKADGGDDFQMVDIESTMNEPLKLETIDAVTAALPVGSTDFKLYLFSHHH